MDFINNKIDTLTTKAKVLTSISLFGETAPAPAPAPVVIIKNETQEISKESVTFDLISYIFWVGIGIYLVQKLIPVGDAYQTLRIVLYVMLVLGGGYPAVFLAVLYFLKMQITKK